MTSHQEKSYKAGETRVKTQEKTGEAMGMMREMTEAAKDKTQGAGRSTQEKAHETAQSAKDETSQGAQTTQQKAQNSKDKTGSYVW
ncbi:unnamed protein product [Brassica rapa]|uniref:Uncharacterized protein n=1 Tax=Brassica campestris TaxID=3711 RepID=A0A8D9HDV0_BRACM|nr:unnamed protein product [Brassica rapa]